MPAPIKKARCKLGLSQKQMAVCMGMTQPMVARLEKRRRYETKGHVASIEALELLEENNLLSEFLRRRTGGNDTD